MGQYYLAYIYDPRSKQEVVYDNKTGGEWNGLKLIEHSYWENPMMQTITSTLYRAPKNVAWVGDYSEDFITASNKELAQGLFQKVWGKEDVSIIRTIVEARPFNMAHQFLVNWAKKEFIDCDEYYSKNVVDLWALHPLSLLTCIGNGLGGGDYYHDLGKEYVGSWFLDEISVEDQKPAAGFKRICPVFELDV